jgi:hypothetical protein
MQKVMRTGCVVAALVAAPMVGVAAAQASESTAYVSPTGSPLHHDRSCADARFSSVQAAVNAVANRGTVYVCRGTYAESVTITRPLHLAGLVGSVIDASNKPYGVGVTAPHTTVSGLTVENATMDQNSGSPGDGIVTAGLTNNGPVPADHVTIIGNLLKNNGGPGIDLNSTSYSVAAHNVTLNNLVGVNVVDDFGKPASHNLVLGNIANDNPGGCGIVLADHSGAGIFANSVLDNTANRNGLGTPAAPNASSGSGIILAGGPGASVHDNTVGGNVFNGNGHGGVTLHAHVPGGNFGGNRIVNNQIGTNNVRTDFADTKSTGIYLGDASPLTITVAGNTIRNDFYGIFTAGQVHIVGSNHFFNVTKTRGSTPSYSG